MHWTSRDAHYLYVYFHGDESRNDDQQVYFAVSDDALRWTALNKNLPVLRSSLGDGGARDPFILRRGSEFILVATDLNTKNPRHAFPDGMPNWRHMEIHGSPNIVLWRSSDLVSWSSPTLIDVSQGMPFGNVWAPKCLIMPDSDDVLVYWASTHAEDNYSKERIYGSWTKDFSRFSEPFLMLAPAFSCIDARFVRMGDMWLLYLKNEEEKTVGAYCTDRLFDASGIPEPLEQYRSIGDSLLKRLTGVEGPSPIMRDDGLFMLYLDEYMNDKRGYFPLCSENPMLRDSFTAVESQSYIMPEGARHGSMLRITSDEYAALSEEYGNGRSPMNCSLAK